MSKQLKRLIEPTIDGVCDFLTKNSQTYNHTGQNGDIKSPKRQCTDYHSVLVERNSFTSPVKDRLLASGNVKSKLPPPPLQSAFARYILGHCGS